MDSFGTIDLHCDTLSRLVKCDKKVTLMQNEFHVDIQKMLKANIAAQFFAIYMEVSKTKDPLSCAIDMIDRFYIEISRCAEKIAFAGSVADIARNRYGGKISALLALEDSGIIGGSLSALRTMYRLGIRLVTLTWNEQNRVGSPHLSEYAGKGLTMHGIEFIREMQRLGMLIDVSHLSDAGFYDVFKETKGPFIASHSNSRTLTPHSRNLTDHMIRSIAERGGVIGVNFYPPFLRIKKDADIDDIVRHIDHIAKVGGIDCVALGSDFDGISSAVAGLENCSRLPTLFIELKKAGYTQYDIDKISYTNAFRVINDVCG